MTNPINKRNVNKIVFLSIFLEIIAPLFSSIPINSGLVIVFRVLVSLIAFFLVFRKEKKIFLSLPLVLYLLWTVYVYIKNLITGVDFWGSPIRMFGSIGTSSICLFLCIYAFRREEIKTINIIIAALFIFCLFPLTLGGMGTGIDESGRLGTDTLNSNAIGIRGALLVFFIILKYLKNFISLKKMVILLVIPTFVVLLTGSRTAFGMSVMYFSIFLFKKNRSFGSVFSKILFGVIAILSYYLIMDNTIIGERLAGTFDQSKGTNLETGTFWDYLGDRGYQYYLGIPLIKHYFWFGMGSGNFRSIVLDTVCVLHSEYLIQFLECGFIAAILYFSVYLWIIKRTFNIKTRVDEVITIKRFILLSMLALLFACLVTRISYYGAYSCYLAYMIFYLKQFLSNKHYSG